jgi:hypothetical protein
VIIIIIITIIIIIVKHSVILRAGNQTWHAGKSTV